MEFTEGRDPVIVATGRFGTLSVEQEDVISVPQGLLGFPEYKKFCLVDPGDETLILWLQSIDYPKMAFPVLEPKIFKPDYRVRLSSSELRELKLDNVNQSAVFSVLTIPENIAEMSANLKAPIVINLRERVAKQVVLQENEYVIRHPMFMELRAHLLTIDSQTKKSSSVPQSKEQGTTAVSISDIPPSLTVKSLEMS